MNPKFLLLALFIFINCGNFEEITVQSSNQPIKDLVRSEKPKANSTNSNRPSSISDTNSFGATGGNISGATGTTPATPAVGSATGGYTGYPTTTGY